MDIISFNEAATANERIERFIENPDSNSGIVTVPKVIGAGENITIPVGRVAVLPNVQVAGTLNIDGEVFIPSGATFGDLESQIALKQDKELTTIATGTATFNSTTNNISLTGIGIGVEIGDVIQISGATDSKNNSEFTVEVITDNNNIIVNQAHANKGTTKNVAQRASNTGVTVKLLAKWYNTSNTLGRLSTSMRTVRAYNTDYVNNTGRDMDITFAAESAAAGPYGTAVSINGITMGYSQKYATSANTASTSSMMTIPKGATYRFTPVSNTTGNPIVVEIR